MEKSGLCKPFDSYRNISLVSTNLNENDVIFAELIICYLAVDKCNGQPCDHFLEQDSSFMYLV